MSDAEDEHEQAIVFDLADEPVIANAMFPEFKNSSFGFKFAERTVALGFGQIKLLRVVRPGGLELPTFWFVARRSIQLSYGRTVRVV